MRDIHYILCAGWRSGTHYLGFLLRKFHLGMPSETFIRGENLRKVPHMAVKDYWEPLRHWKHNFLGADDHQGEARIYSRWVPIQYFENIIKSLRKKADVLDVPDADLLDHIYPGIKFIYLYREDYVKQAISRYKGLQTEQWNSFQRAKKEPTYSLKGIAEQLIMNLDAKDHWSDIFVRYGIEPLDVVYEDFCKAPREWLLRIKEHLGVNNDVPITAEAIQVHMEDEKAPQKMSDHINTEWEKRFYRDLKRLKNISPGILKRLCDIPLPVEDKGK